MIRSFIKIKRSVFVSVLIAALLLLLTKCINKESSQEKQPITNAYGEAFAGSASCENCHKNIFESHLKTAHYLTSQPATKQFIKGNFDSGKNVFWFNNFVKVVMEKRDSGFYQVEYVNGLESKKGRFDVVIGSGTKGQTYLYWQENKLLQLPLFYYSDLHEWANSPGFPGTVIFSRPATSRCLECHATYAQKLSEPMIEPEEFDHEKIIFGVDCERCHGPAAKHVAYQTENSTDTVAKFIINPAKLSRLQQLNLCSLCHGGRMFQKTAAFLFQAGDTLENYFLPDTAKKTAANIDVHGNQYGLLAASKCFIQSSMTCTTCHNVHENEAGKTEMFSQKCMTCHNEAHNNFCKMSKTIGPTITQNCIDCHMPVKASKAIVFLRQGETKPSTAFMRSHYIKIYPDETKKMLDYIKTNSKKEAVVN